MDSTTLFAIIIIEAVIIVWLMSKLKQYRKFEHLLSTAPASEAQQSAQTQQQESADSLTAAAAAPGVQNTTTMADELLEMPGVDPEANIEEAKRVQLVMARCRYAEFYLEQLDDDYERDQFKRIIKSCISTAKSISDPFFQASALHPLIVLLDKAEWHDRRDQLLADVKDDIVRERISSELGSQKA
ncbi:MAG: hypothetical protein AB8B79_05395 [Granulosicoccus sp.]